MANRGIEYVLSLNATKFQSAMNAVAEKTKAAADGVAKYWRTTESGVQRAGSAVGSFQTKVIGAVAAIGGFLAVKSIFGTVVASAKEADSASFNLSTSIQAANREFKVGDSKSWAANIKSLTSELKVYSATAVTEAVVKTIDMTKRLGLSEQQMIKVVRAAANLSAGKFELSDGVERVTAALRGEAEASEALGLTLSENYVKGWYEARGATQGAWKDLTDLQKAQVRYNVLLQQSDPLQGKAAKSAGTYGGALTMLSGNYESLKASLGEVVTRNSLFIEGIGRVSTFIKGLNVDVDGNRQKWIDWSKQSTLAVLDFSVAGIKAGNSLYAVFSGISGGVKETLAYYYQLKASFLDGAASGAKWKDALGLTSGEAQRLGTEAAAAASKADALSASAAKSFAAMDAGSPKILAAAESLQKFRDEVAKIEAKEIIPGDAVADQSKAVQEEIVKIGNKWTNVGAKINSETVKPKIEVDQEAYNKSIGLLKEAVKNQAENAEEVHKKAAHGASGSWDEAADSFESSWSRAIDEIASKLNNLKSKSSGASGSFRNGGEIGAYKIGGAIQALASGGGVRNIIAGGNLPGFGGGDKVSLLGEAGEYMLNKWASFKAGLPALKRLNVGDLQGAIAELSKRVKNRAGYRLGGLVGLPQITQRLASGGAVAAGGGSGGYSASFTFSDAGRVGRVYGSEVDIKGLERAIKKQERYRSSNR